jgi:hypothetical protein
LLQSGKLGERNGMNHAPLNDDIDRKVENPNYDSSGVGEDDEGGNHHEIEITIEAHDATIEGQDLTLSADPDPDDDDDRSLGSEKTPDIPPPPSGHRRQFSKDKSNSFRAFEGDLNPFEFHQMEDDDMASVGNDEEHIYRPLPIPHPFGHPTPQKFQSGGGATSSGGGEERRVLSTAAATAETTEDSDEERLLYQRYLLNNDGDMEVIVATSHLQHESRLVDKDASIGSCSNNNRSNKVSSTGTTPSAPSSAKVTSGSRSVITAGIESFKYLYSLALLIFCVVLVMGAIFTKQTTSTANEFSTVGAFFVFWFLIVWLAMMEGGQGALVGLQPIDKSLYQNSHPKAYRLSTLVHKGDNMERFIVGRQFLVVLVVFVSQLMSSPIPDIKLWGLSQGLTEIFLNSGVALMVVTIVLGQLTAQLNAANCMLDFINNHFLLYFVAYLSLAMEFSGLLHAVYLVQLVFARITSTPVDTNEPVRNRLQQLFFWGRVVFSLLVLGFAFAVTLSALFQGQTTMWQGIPEVVSVILFFLLMCFVGMMEGMQIALFAVVNVPPEELAKQSAIAHKNCQLTFQGENLQAFLIGRQICVTICTFIIARITTLDVEVGVDPNIFGVSDGLQAFFNTGLLGAVITTIVSSLAWRIIASSFPVAFLSNPLIGLIIRLCLLLEASGLCSSAWVLARYHKPMVNYQPDEVYLEDVPPHTAEPVTSRDRDIDRFVTVVRFSYSLGLLLFCVLLVTAAIFTEQTNVTSNGGLPPTATFFIFWFLIVWLSMMEGAQGCLIGLQNVNKGLYAETHPRSLKSTTIIQEGDNMERFIIGRQFLVVVIIFLAQWMTKSIPNVSILGLPAIVNEIFLSSGLALALIVIILGQLTAQVNAANCMLDFVNSYFVFFFVTYFSLAVEYSGILHAVYLVQILFSKITGKSIGSNESGRGVVQQAFFVARVIFSLTILSYAIAVTMVALIEGKTAMWPGVKNAATMVMFFAIICVVGMMEGVQIALFSIINNLSAEELKANPFALANYKLTFSGQNLQAFLIGRQICVTFCFFVLARITTTNVQVGVENSIFGVSNAVQEFFNTGLLGALITTILASLVWRILASSFPVAFMSNPLINVIIRFCLLVETSGICSACWVFGRWEKLLFGYQPDEIYLEGMEKQGKEPVTRRDKDIDVTVTVIKYICSTALLGFAIAITMSLILTGQTVLSANSHPAIAFCLIWFLLIWLAVMEGGQGCLVGLQGIDTNLYKESHKVTLKNVQVAHKGDNMQRFIVGRQFLVVLVVFITNLCANPIPGSKVFGLPDAVGAIFVDSGISVILTTVVVGQLAAQVNAASCMLDFINNHFMLYFVTYVSMAIEFSGILHCVYLVQILFGKLTGTQIESAEPLRNRCQHVSFWGRALFSLAVLGFAFSITLSALFQNKTTTPDGIPEAASVVVFFLLMCVAGLMEGMQIALFAVVNMPEKELVNHKLAQSICNLTFSGNNLQAFLIGRQICVTLCTFVIARITTLDVDVGEGQNIFGVSDGIQYFFNTGLLGAIITTIVGSLAWRIIAATFPVAFLSNPLVYIILRICLAVEASGVCSAAWLLALINRQIAGIQPDETYIGTREERGVSAEKIDLAQLDGEIVKEQKSTPIAESQFETLDIDV